jgi:squalene cyclase
VTAAAGLLAVAPSTLSYLRAVQRADGAWPGYWWEDDEYATAWAVQSLAVADRRDAAARRGVAWCASRIGADGAVHSRAHGDRSPFATALAAYAIRVGCGDGDAGRAAERAERWLLSNQLDDGMWEPSARMQVPLPEIRLPPQGPDQIERYVRDAGVFTTATVLAALSASPA